MFCQRCGQQLDPAAMFCHKCGTSLASGTPGSLPAPDQAGVATAPAPERTKKCPFCSETIAEAAIKCRFCNSMLYQQAAAVPPQPVVVRTEKRVAPSDPPKDPVLMAFLSGCCIAGLGQIILGQTLKGVIILIGSMLLGAVTGGFSIIITWPLGAVDAYLIAKKLKDGNTVAEWEFF